MASIIRTVRNVTLLPINLAVPGYNSSKPTVTIPSNTTVDLFTVLTGDELQASQTLLNVYVQLRIFLVVDTIDTASFNPIGSVLNAVGLVGQHADIPGSCSNNTKGGSFFVTAITNSTHMVVDSTAGFAVGNSLANGNGSATTTVTAVTDATHLVVGSTAGFAAAPVLFTPTVTGLYQISYYNVGTGTDAGTNNPGLQLSYKDNWGVQSGILNNPLTLTPGSTASGTMLIQSVANVPVYYSVVNGGYDAGSSYSLYITASKLN